MTYRKDGPGSKSGPKSRATETAFDKWLNRGLHELFDDVMKEPIPPQLLDILQNSQVAADTERQNEKPGKNKKLDDKET